MCLSVDGKRLDSVRHWHLRTQAQLFAHALLYIDLRLSLVAAGLAVMDGLGNSQILIVTTLFGLSTSVCLLTITLY